MIGMDVDKLVQVMSVRSDSPGVVYLAEIPKEAKIDGDPLSVKEKTQVAAIEKVRKELFSAQLNKRNATMRGEYLAAENIEKKIDVLLYLSDLIFSDIEKSR